MKSRLVTVLVVLVLLGLLLADRSGSGGVATSPSPKPSDPAGPPVASFTLADHALGRQLPSPDRMKVASSADPGYVSPPPGEGMQRYLDQKLIWAPCDPEGYLCAKVVVPLDWDDPDGRAITLALKRHPADGKSRGTMFVNPGGPGVEAQSMTEVMGPDFPDHDVVAWDPRGSGESTPVRCGTTAQIDAINAVDFSPETEPEWATFVKVSKEFAALCRTNSGDLLDHISTLDTARDMDYLRHLVGEQKLNFFGISYGTALGAVYAELYPTRVGRMVLDSAVNITDDDSVSQATGFEGSLNAFADWCAEQDCSGLGDSREQVRASITQLLNKLDAQPIGAGDRAVTETRAFTGIVTFLYSGEYGYRLLGDAIQSAQNGDGSALLMMADAQVGRGSDGYDPSVGAFPAIGCSDSGDEGAGVARAEWQRWTKQAPLVGYYMGPNLTCAYWTAQPEPNLRLVGKGAAPIVVLGTTGDPATPYKQAEWMADQLDSAVLVTWKGAGHSAWMLGNKCVKDAVRGYVEDGKVPADRTTC